MEKTDPTQDNKNYKWLFFYFNTEDERIFVPKKLNQLGVTLNFAKPKSYLALLAMGLFFGFIVFMISLKK